MNASGLHSANSLQMGSLQLNAHGIDNYNDINALQKIKHVDDAHKDAQLDAVAKQFESLFVSMMIKSMRDANKVFAEGNMLQSNETDFYQEMFDSQIAVTMSSGRGIGLADVIKRQLSFQSNRGVGENNSSDGTPVFSMEGYTRKRFPERERLEAMYDALKQVDETIAAKGLGEASQDTATVSSVSASPESASVASVSSGAYSQGNHSASTHLASTHLASTMDFSTPDKFIESLYPYAQSVERETGVDARLMLAQSALETGWGKHQIMNEDGSPSHNLFGIKAQHGWQGEKAEILTTEYRQGVAMKERAEFRAYGSYKDSFHDYAKFLQNNDRYQPAFEHLDDPKEFAHALQASGYATDPRYGEKISSILDRYLLSENKQSSPETVVR